MSSGGSRRLPTHYLAIEETESRHGIQVFPSWYTASWHQQSSVGGSSQFQFDPGRAGDESNRLAGSSISTGVSRAVAGLAVLVGIVVIGLALPLWLTMAFTGLSGVVASAVIGAVAGFAVGGLSTGTLEGAFAGAGVGALIGAGGTAAGFSFVMAGVWNGVGSALISFASQQVAFGSVEAGIVAISGLLGTTTGWFGRAAEIAFRSAGYGGNVLVVLDSLLAVISPSPSALSAAGGQVTTEVRGGSGASSGPGVAPSETRVDIKRW